jgi:hypothetical protein
MCSTRSFLGLSRETHMFVGRQSEVARVREAIRRRASLLIWGARGSGKSALLAHSIAMLPQPVNRRCLWAMGHGSPQEILRSIAQNLEQDPLFMARFRGETSRGASFSHWVSRQTSLRLRGLLYRAARAGEYWIILEDLAPMTSALKRIAKELMVNQETPIYSTARGASYTELGYGVQLYWNDRLKLYLGGLDPAAARELLEHSIQKFGLSRFNLQGFREELLELSGSLPGAIIGMCAAAADHRYHFHGRIKTKLLHVDYLMQRHEPRTAYEHSA